MHAQTKIHLGKYYEDAITCRRKIDRLCHLEDSSYLKYNRKACEQVGHKQFYRYIHSWPSKIHF